VLRDVDGRSVVARRYRDIIGAVVSDQGGAEHLNGAFCSNVGPVTKTAMEKRTPDLGGSVAEFL